MSSRRGAVLVALSLIRVASAVAPVMRRQQQPVGRRAWLRGAALLGGAASGPGSVALADWREYTALAPLGDASNRIGGGKQTGLSMADLADRLTHDVTLGATGLGGYLVSADLDPSLFADECRFVDPTNDVASLSRYVTALGILFDPAESRIDLVGGPVIRGSTISATLRSAGVLKLPWRPVVREYETSIVWTVGADGLVHEQAQRWSITAAEALAQTFTPGALRR